LLRQRRRPEAATFLEQAQARVDEAGSEALRRRLEKAWAELRTVARLEDIWLDRPRLLGGMPDTELGAKYTRVFADAGLGVEGDEGELAARIHESAVRRPLVAALEDWASTTADRELQSRLLRLARLADPDPKWRDRLRDPAVGEDRRALERLAAEAPVADLPPPTVDLLGQLLARKGVDSEPLLREAQRCQPGDFWVNFNLGVRWLDTHDGGLPSGEEDALGRHLHNGLEAQLLRLQAEAWPKASSPRREATRPGTR
jgi:hypothetical protein